MNRMGITRRPRIASFPTGVMSGSSRRWRVRSISGENSISNPGISVNTDSRLSRMALMSTTAMSRPMPNCMKPSAARPLTVVSDEALISGMAFASASMHASRTGFVSCSSEKRWHRMMA